MMSLFLTLECVFNLKSRKTIERYKEMKLLQAFVYKIYFLWYVEEI